MKKAFYRGLFSGVAAVWLSGCAEFLPENEIITNYPITVTAGQSVFVVKINQSDRILGASRTGQVYREGERGASAGREAPGRRTVVSPDAGSLIRQEHPGVAEFNRRLPNLLAAEQNPSRSADFTERNASFIPPQLDSERNFWVENENGLWVSKPAKLQAIGTHCNVWVMNDNFNNASATNTDNEINRTQARTIASKFDAIYEYETPIFGYEYGGGPGGGGGRDGDPKIQILVYDIDGDAASGSGAVTAGYFWGKDFYDQFSLNQEYTPPKAPQTNNAEIFYLDSAIVDKRPDLAYSTLVHEFQHMLHFNNKTLNLGQSTAVWYNEMLSMLAEDMISPLIGIAHTSQDHPIKVRIPLFLDNYFSTGVNEWKSNTTENALMSYSNVYAFGAYLARNYGGAELVKAIAQNNQRDAASLSSALSALNPGVDFRQALSRYGEALVYKIPQNGKNSFNKAVVKTINSQNYTFYAFNLWTISNTGPVHVSTESSVDIPGNGILIESRPEWQNMAAQTLNLRIAKPEFSPIEIVIIIR